MMTARNATSCRRHARARAITGPILTALALTWISTAAAWSTETQSFGTSPCAVPSSSYPTLQSAIDDPACEGAILASGDYPGPFRLTRDFPITGPDDFSARLLGGLDIEGNANVDVRLEYVQVQAGVDPALIFADGFETGNTTAWSSTTP